MTFFWWKLWTFIFKKIHKIHHSRFRRDGLVASRFLLPLSGWAPVWRWPPGRTGSSWASARRPAASAWRSGPGPTPPAAWWKRSAAAGSSWTFPVKQKRCRRNVRVSPAEWMKRLRSWRLYLERHDARHAAEVPDGGVRHGQVVRRNRVLPTVVTV